MIRERIDALRDRFERLSQRERTMVTALGITLVVFMTLVVGFLIADKVGSMDERNADMRQALKDIETQRDSYLKAKAKTSQLETRVGHQPVQLSGFLEQCAKDAGVQIPESNEQPAVAAGKNYIQRSIDLRLKAVRLEQLAAFLRRIETGPNLVMVTALSVRTRDDKHEELDVEMTVSAYEHAPKEKQGAKKGDKT